MPDAYVILCDATDSALFSPYGVVIGIPSFTALTNGGDSLTLLDNTGTLVDIVAYEDTWYNDPVKQDGGWSLELINPNQACGFANNWTASNDPGGGTPGFVNSVYDTLPDTIPPGLTSAMVLSATQIRLTFSESMDSLSLMNGSYLIDTSVLVTSILVSSADFTKVELTLNGPLDTGTVYTVTASNMSDCSGSSISSNNTAQFFISYPVAKFDVLITEILPDPSPPVSLPDAEFVELYNASSKAFDLAGWDVINSTTSNPLPPHLLFPDAYVILCDVLDTALFSPYGAVIGISTFTSLTNGGDSLTLLDNNGTVVDIVVYEDSWYNDLAKDDGGWSLELINPNQSCSFANNWTASNNPGGGTPGFANSVYDILPDTIAPGLTSAIALSPTLIKLTFSESMDSLSLINGSYLIDTTVFVMSIQVSSMDFTKVELTLSGPIDTGTVYTVTAGNVSDCSGNSLSSNNSAQFLISFPIERFDILITEIFADPSPAIGLPEFEFIEYYNNSNKPFNFFNESIFYPGEYVIRCSEAAGPSFEPFGKVLTKSSFGSLSNAGDTWTLLYGGDLVHSVTYTDRWYGDNNKDDGGWSLEMIDVNNPCAEESNWRASVDPSGGTPGRQNSVMGSNPDNSPPKLLRADAPDILNVMLTFDEPLDSNDMKKAIYTIDKGLVVDSLSVESTKTIKLILGTDIQPSTVYTVTVSGLNDCVGNTIASDNTALFALPDQVQPGDLIINEILSNPTSDGSDFVELYNNSNRYINIDGWQLANWDDDSIANFKPIASVPYVLFPGDYVLLSENTSILDVDYPLGNTNAYLEVEDIPTYSNDDGTVILLNNVFGVADSFTYSKDMHFSLLNDLDGVSLERLDFNRPAHDKTNWHSAAQDVGFATPGYKNSQSNPADSVEGDVLVFPEIFSPDNDGVDDVVDINYSFESGGFVASIFIYDSRGRLIKILVQNELLGTKGTFSWDGTLENGEKGRLGIYVIFFEAFGLLGEIKQFKRSCVLAGRL